MNVEVKGKYGCKIGIDNPKCELSKRELIAAMALQGFLSSGDCNFNHEEFTKITASNSVIMADALLKALKIMTYLETYFMIKIYILIGFFTILGTVGAFWIVWSFILPYKWRNWINKKVKRC